MRLFQRHLMRVQVNGRQLYGCLRPLSGQWQQASYGAFVQDVKRLLLPYGSIIHPGDRLETEEGPYLCLSVRLLPGHVQADIRRCMPCGT